MCAGWLVAEMSNAQERGPCCVDRGDRVAREPDGVALAVQAPDREAVGAFVDDDRTGLDAFSEVEVHNWEFGGRR